jgi:hypothetical protein
MTRVPVFAWLFAVLASGAAGLPAQKQERFEVKYVDAAKMERATKADDHGILQWSTDELPQCPVCKGSKETACPTCNGNKEVTKCIECGGDNKAPCRTCCAQGHLPDLLKHAHCPACLGAGFQLCVLCQGGGWVKLEGGGGRKQDCDACRGAGGHPCPLCNGARLCESAKVKPSLAEAPVEALKKARADVEAAMKALDAFTVTGKNMRKELKEYAKVTAAAQAVLPPFKKVQKALDDTMAKVDRASQFKNFEEMQVAAVTTWKKANEYYLKAQKRILDLCIARAEQNGKAAPGAGAKK